jgi:hypothetical protein
MAGSYFTLPPNRSTFLAPNSNQFTIDNTHGGGMTFQLGVGWPARFDDHPEITVDAGVVYGPMQRRFDAIRFTGVSGTTRVEMVSEDEVSPIPVSPT